MAIQKTTAIVLKTQPFRSSSLIVTFFTRSFGKVRGLAKGVRLEREMRGALYELFALLDLVFYEKSRSDLHLISEALILDSHEPVRGRLESIAYASYFAELVDLLCEVHDPHEKIFDLLDFCLNFVASLPGRRLARLFEIKLLNEIGWLPYLESCLQCQTPVFEGAFFSARQGGVYCARCAPQVPDARPLGTETLAVMRHFIKHDLDAAIRHGYSQAVENELEATMNRFFLDRLGTPFKSRVFLDKIQPALKA